MLALLLMRALTLTLTLLLWRGRRGRKGLDADVDGIDVDEARNGDGGDTREGKCSCYSLLLLFPPRGEVASGEREFPGQKPRASKLLLGRG